VPSRDALISRTFFTTTGVGESSIVHPASAVVNSQFATVNFLANKCSQTLSSTFHIDEIRVGETSWLASTPINGNSDINDILNITEELVEISIGHLEGEVADEEGFGRRVGRIIPRRFCHIVNDKSATFKDCLMLSLNGGGGFFDRSEFDISESVPMIVSNLLSRCVVRRYLPSTVPINTTAIPIPVRGTRIPGVVLSRGKASSGGSC
jgi:hypothetical protein